MVGSNKSGNGVRALIRAMMAACVTVGACSSVAAQVPEKQVPEKQAPENKAAKLATKSAAAPAPGAAASSGGDSGLKSRVESLEEQLVDMQVVVGTLESLAKSGGAVPRPPVTGGADVGRIESLETQVRALSGQVQQLTDQVRSLGGTPRRSDASAVSSPTSTAALQSDSTTFGSTTVSNTGGDAIGGLIEGSPMPPVQDAPATAPGNVTMAALPPGGEASSPKQLYETAYGYMLQRDYGAAEVSFDDFLKRFPNDSLAGNAQYWLGESYFVRGQYKAAAGAFLKGYQTYAQSAKAPDSLLKLAMSLDRLGQKDAACSSYSELAAKFPSAPQSVKARAQSERQRVGCP